MIDTGKIATVWNAKEVMRLDAEGWRTLQKSIVPSSDGVDLLCWHMYPPEPTLVETWRAMDNRWDEPLYARTVAALERAAKIEAAAARLVEFVGWAFCVNASPKMVSMDGRYIQDLREALGKEKRA